MSGHQAPRAPSCRHDSRRTLARRVEAIADVRTASTLELHPARTGSAQQIRADLVVHWIDNSIPNSTIRRQRPGHASTPRLWTFTGHSRFLVVDRWQNLLPREVLATSATISSAVAVPNRWLERAPRQQSLRGCMSNPCRAPFRSCVRPARARNEARSRAAPAHSCRGSHAVRSGPSHRPPLRCGPLDCDRRSPIADGWADARLRARRAHSGVFSRPSTVPMIWTARSDGVPARQSGTFPGQVLNLSSAWRRQLASAMYPLRPCCSLR